MEYRICNRCVMDTSDVDISFDAEGNCNHCNNFFERIAPQIYNGESSDKELEKNIKKIKDSGRNKKYDCLIGISGGIDSSYVAYIAKNKGLRPLLVHLDNGWNTESSINNIKKISKGLDLECEYVKLEWEEFKDIQIAFLKASIPEIETPTDMAIPAVLQKVAAKHDIKYIISGGNFATEGILPKTWHYNAKDKKYFKYIYKKFGNKKLKTFPLFGIKEEFYYKIFKGIKYYYLLNHIPYDKQTALNVLQSKFGWEYYGFKHGESSYTGFVQSYILPKKFNIDYRRATFSTQICAGYLDRNTALETLKNNPWNEDTIDADKEFICEKLGISIEEFEKIMQEKPLFYNKYPNCEKFINFVYKVYRKLTNRIDYKGD